MRLRFPPVASHDTGALHCHPKYPTTLRPQGSSGPYRTSPLAGEPRLWLAIITTVSPPYPPAPAPLTSFAPLARAPCIERQPAGWPPVVPDMGALLLTHQNQHFSLSGPIHTAPVSMATYAAWPERPHRSLSTSRQRDCRVRVMLTSGGARYVARRHNHLD